VAAVREAYHTVFEHTTMSDCISLSIEGTQQLDINREGFTYGESSLRAVYEVMSSIDLSAFAQADGGELDCRRRTGAVVYDLGSGIGNVVVGVALLAASGATALLFGGVAWTSTRQDRTLRAMASFAETIPFDRLATTRLPEPRDEPDAERLAQACNRLLKRVADAGAAQQRFVADAAHELRTPLTILRGEIQVALREPPQW
jgi:signal transduction histidine kinase